MGCAFSDEEGAQPFLIFDFLALKSLFLRSCRCIKSLVKGSRKQTGRFLPKNSKL